MSKHSKKNNLSGFTLIEMAVVLTILALSAAGGLTILSKAIRAQKTDDTNDKMEHIMSAIEAYVTEYGHLPCPTSSADGLGEEESGFGIGTATNNCSSIPGGFKSAANNVVRGFVPVYTLKLSPDYFYDGWNRRFSYIVDEDLTSSAGFDANTGSIDIQNSAGVTLTGGELAAVLLISHGERGHGAHRLKGANPTQIDDGLTPPNYEEANGNENSAFDTLFRDVPHRNIDGGTDETDEPFDDYLMYRTQWQLDPPPPLP